MKKAWLVTVNSGAEYSRAFYSYERAIEYYNENVEIIEEHVEECDYEKIVTKTYGGKEILTHFKQWDKDYKHFKTLGIVSIKQIEMEEQLNEE